MGQPKAKWSPYDEDTKRIWTAAVGPFYLDVNANDGTCEIAEWEADSGTIGETLWEQDVPTPCDVVDLMLLAEAELERRLREAAETMSGEELVAEPLSSGPTHRYPVCAALDCCEEQSWGRGFWPGLCETHARLKERANELAATGGLVCGSREWAISSLEEEPWKRLVNVNRPGHAWHRLRRECVLERDKGTWVSQELPEELKSGWSVLPVASEPPAEGSREWAIAEMRRGDQLIDEHGRAWIWYEQEDEFRCSDGRILAFVPDELRCGWCT